MLESVCPRKFPHICYFRVSSGTMRIWSFDQDLFWGAYAGFECSSYIACKTLVSRSNLYILFISMCRCALFPADLLHSTIVWFKSRPERMIFNKQAQQSWHIAWWELHRLLSPSDLVLPFAGLMLFFFPLKPRNIYVYARILLPGEVSKYLLL